MCKIYIENKRELILIEHLAQTGVWRRRCDCFCLSHASSPIESHLVVFGSMGVDVEVEFVVDVVIVVSAVVLFDAICFAIVLVSYSPKLIRFSTFWLSGTSIFMIVTPFVLFVCFLLSSSTSSVSTFIVSHSVWRSINSFSALTECESATVFPSSRRSSLIFFRCFCADLIIMTTMAYNRQRKENSR